MARRKKADEKAARVRNLLALDAAGIMRRLEARRDEMFLLFSRLRNRDPLLETVASRYAEGVFDELIHLPEQEQAIVDRFYDRLDEVRWYFTYTEDMPGTAQQAFIQLHKRLEEAYRALVACIGHPISADGVRVVDAEPIIHREETTAPSARALPALEASQRRHRRA